MPAKLDEIVDTFRSVDPEMRLELLLDYAKRLPPLPERLKAARDAGLNRVEECMTPVYLYVETKDGVLRVFADVAQEAPTVRGFMSILVEGVDGAGASDIEALPNDLVERMGLSEVLRMNRTVGLSAVLARLKKAASAAQM